MDQWLAALSSCSSPAVLVTVAAAQGSVPREAGAKMLVTGDAQFDTIGGGHLDWCASSFARDMLAAGLQQARGPDTPQQCNQTLNPPRPSKMRRAPRLGKICPWDGFDMVNGW